MDIFESHRRESSAHCRKINERRYGYRRRTKAISDHFILHDNNRFPLGTPFLLHFPLFTSITGSFVDFFFISECERCLCGVVILSLDECKLLRLDFQSSYSHGYGAQFRFFSHDHVGKFSKKKMLQVCLDISDFGLQLNSAIRSHLPRGSDLPAWRF